LKFLFFFFVIPSVVDYNHVEERSEYSRQI
jgi:hypothetical protein